MIKELHYLHGKPQLTGLIRETEHDFFVEETLSFTSSGEGEHLFLYIEKVAANTEWVGKQLAKFYDVSPKAVSWAGLKDRHAVTRQWFGVHLPGRKEVGEWPMHDEFKVLESTFNDRKLRLGAIAFNRFEITVTHLDGDRTELETRLNAIKQQGLPNYFGEQRFGKEGSNLKRAEKWLLNGERIRRNDQSMALSAIRSQIFNQLVSERLQSQGGKQVMLGDVLVLDATKSIFVVTQEELSRSQSRLEAGDCHLSTLLVGAGENRATDDALEYEQITLQTHQHWIEALEKQKVKASRRALRVVPKQFEWQLSDEKLLLKFALPTGSYATSVLREIVDYKVANS